MSFVVLPRSAIVALALPLTFSTAALAETGVDAAQGPYYSDPLISIERGTDKGHILTPEQSSVLPAAPAKTIRTVGAEPGASAGKVAAEHSKAICSDAGGTRCSGAPGYLPDSHVNLDYFPARSSYGYFPATR